MVLRNTLVCARPYTAGYTDVSACQKVRHFAMKVIIVFGTKCNLDIVLYLSKKHHNLSMLSSLKQKIHEICGLAVVHWGLRNKCSASTAFEK